jgi:hypothetical protein
VSFIEWLSSFYREEHLIFSLTYHISTPSFSSFLFSSLFLFHVWLSFQWAQG